MKLGYAPLRSNCKVSGTVIMQEEGADSAEVKVEWLIAPRMAMLFVPYQKLQFIRKVGTMSHETAFIKFMKDVANLLNCFELELTPKGEPHYVVNSQAIKDAWAADGQTILRAKYVGDWVEQELAVMTEVIGDEKKLRKAVLQDFCLSELYSRKIYGINFDGKTHTASQTCTETALDGIPFVFEQWCSYKQYLREQVVVIDGIAPISENQQSIAQLCKGKTYRSEDIITITQHTEYRAFELLNIPESITTVFQINGKNGCLKKVSIDIETNKI